MDLLVLFSLALHILSDRLFVSMPANGVHVEPAAPKMTSPEHLLDLGVKPKQFFGCDSFGCFNDLRWSHHGNGLNEKVNVILICPDLHILQFVTLLNFIADVLECCLNFLCKYLPAVLGGADEVIEKKSDVVTFVKVLAAHEGSLPRFTSSIAL